MIILHPIVVAHIAGKSGRVIFIRWKSENLKTFACNLCAGVLFAVCSLCSPLIIRRVWVVSGDFYSATVGNRFFIPSDFYRSHHRLTGISKTARRTMVKYIPLTVDFLNRAVSIVCSVGFGESRTVFVEHNSARIYQNSARTPRT